MNELILTKESTASEIKVYFQKVLELKRSGEEFPVDFDEVWPIIYEYRHKASEFLKENFIEGVDFYLTQTGKVVKSNELQNGIKAEAKLTVSCMEFFVARKARSVFEVYRSVFHKVAEQSKFQLPQTFSEALMLAAKQAEQIESQQKQITSQAPKVLFADAVATSDRCVLVSELAKILKQNGVDIGQNRLFIWLREKGYLCSKGEYYNQPTQKAMEMGLFELKKTSITKPDGTVLVTVTTKVTGKGQVYFVNKFLNKAA